MIRKLDDIVKEAQGRGRRRLVVAHAQDPHTLESVGDAVRIGLIEATLVGGKSEIEAICMERGIDSGGFTIVESDSDTESAAKAVAMVCSGKADILMKGIIPTDRYMHAILNKEHGLLPPKGVLSHVVVLEMPQYHKLLAVSDVAVIPSPDITQKIAITRYTVAIAKSLGIPRPKVAVIAPSELVLPTLQSSADAAIIAKMGDRGEFGDAIVDGPLALDVALYEKYAAVKRLSSPVAGDPDCLVFPNLDSANVFFKSATKLCGAELAGLVTGTKAPCVLTSRGDSEASKLYSIALASLTAAESL